MWISHVVGPPKNAEQPFLNINFSSQANQAWNRVTLYLQINCTLKVHTFYNAELSVLHAPVRDMILIQFATCCEWDAMLLYTERYI